MSYSPNGKIARLPKSIRDELCHRLENAEQGRELVKWLNGHERVQKILKEHFGGRPITEQNLSEWKQRNFQEWQRRQEACENIRSLSERAGDLDEAADGMEITDRLGSILAAELAGLVVKLEEEVADPKERLRQLKEIFGMLRHLRREDHIGQRVQLQRERWEREVGRQNEEDLERMKQESKKNIRSRLFGLIQKPTIAKLFGGGETGERIAECLYRNDCDLPLDGLMDDKPATGKTPPNKIKLNPTQSDPIRPNQTKSANGHPSSGGNHETPV